MSANTLEQLPARMLNEFAYCPRLFHLEYVQGEWAHNADTLDGRFVHRRVDRPEGRVPEAEALDEASKLHGRSVTVGSTELGAIAVVDLIEAEGRRVTPVDYKRGSAPDVPEGAWEPERVQVCLQGLLLRANGYECERGVLYFAASQTKVDVPMTGELVARTLELLALAREAAKSEQVPAPLVDSPKCPRCSLVGICLPDETNMLRPAPLVQLARRGESEVRRLVPARDDRTPLYVQGQGYSVGLKGDVLEVREKGKRVDEVRLLDLSQVSLFGNVQVSAQALREIVARDVVVAHMSYGGWLAALTTPPPHKNIELRRRQFKAAEDNAVCLMFARAFVAGKVRNCRTFLRRNARDLAENTLMQLASARRAAERAERLDSLLGIEGGAARIYFSELSKTFKSADGAAPGFDFGTRNRRPPRDPVNAMLSFVYALLVKDVTATLVSVGFDPYLGFYHQPRYGRPALALDLMEEFRPLVADSVVVGVINNGEVRPGDFVSRAGAVALTGNGRKRMIEAYERRLDQLVTHPLFGYAASYRRIFEIQARLLARTLTGEIDKYPPFCTR